MDTRTIIFTILIVLLLIFTLLIVMGKCDKWYLWSVKDDCGKVNIIRWRICAAATILSTIAVIALCNILDYTQHLGVIVSAIVLAGTFIERIWAKKK